MIYWVLVVVATVNGAASVATREFRSQTLCDAVAADLVQHNAPLILNAKCVARVMT